MSYPLAAGVALKKVLPERTQMPRALAWTGWVAGGTNTWGQTRKLLASDATTNDWLGWSVAVAGDFAVAGAPGDSGMTGAAYILPVSAETKEFFQTDKLTAADGTTNDWFSFSVAVAGDVAMVGVPHDSDAGNESGSAYVYERHAGGTNA